MFFGAMPGQPKKKDLSNKTLYQAYSRDNLQKALHSVTMKNMSQREANKILGVPHGTISDYVYRNHTINDCKPGCKPLFSPMVEAEMVKAVTDAAQMGLGLSRFQFMPKAGNVACQMGIKTPWKTAPGESGCMVYINVMMS